MLVRELIVNRLHTSHSAWHLGGSQCLLVGLSKVYRKAFENHRLLPNEAWYDTGCLKGNDIYRSEVFLLPSWIKAVSRQLVYIVLPKEHLNVRGK